MKPTVGEQLCSARESRGLTLEDAVKATNIRRAYLQELENDHPELLHSATQARGFLRLYASYLGIPAPPLIAQWKSPVDKNVEAEIQAEDTDGEDISPVEQSLGPATEEMDAVEEPAEPESEKEKIDLNAWLSDVLSRIPKISQFLPGRKEADKPEKSLPAKEEVTTREAEESAQDAHIPRASAEILADIGTALRERREALELTLTDVETFTNVKRMYLEAMESGQFERLPSTVQGRGMLNNFSRFLALDESWIMDAYAKALLALRAEKERGTRRKMQPPLTVRLNIPEKWRRILNPDLIIGGIFIIAVFSFIIWGGAQVFNSSRSTPTDALSISEMLQQTSTPTPLAGTGDDNGGSIVEVTPIPGVSIVESTPTAIATVNASPLQLYIIAKDRAYMRVVVDGFEAFDGRVVPDDVYTFSGEEEITLLTGSGAALEAYFNQEYLGNLGGVGEVVDITFTLQGLSTPTPLPTRTPTPDPRPAEGDAMEEN